MTVQATPGPFIKVAPFVQGAATRARVIVRRADRPRYLALSAEEVETCRQLAGDGARLDDYLAHHLGGRGVLDFKAAVNLILKLHQAHFIENTTDDMQERLAEFSQSSSGGGTRIGVLLAFGQRLLDLPLLKFRASEVSPTLRVLGAALVSLPALIAGAVALITLGVMSGAAELPDERLVQPLLERPMLLICALFVLFSAATSWIAFVQMAALAGAGARFVGGSIRLTGLCVLRLAVRDDDALILPRPAMLRYFALTLLAPWLSALGAYQVGVTLRSELPQLVALAFGMIGLFSLCPLYRGPLVRLGEGMVATLGLLEQATAYLSQGLFLGLREKKKGAADASQIWLTALATLSIVWLYGMSLLLSDALVAAVPELLVIAMSKKHLPDTLAAGALLFVLGCALAVPAVRLLMIPFQNLAALASLPLHRARRGLSSFYDKRLPPSAALANFLRDIPILAGLDDQGLSRVAASLKYRRFAGAQSIIRAGEPGEEFYILAEGQAQVIVGGNGSPEQIVDLLSPGDSFGEIALIENVRRTATIRALSPCKCLVLERRAFDQIFPDGPDGPDGSERQRLTSFIRQVKLVLETEALSHLQPRQVRDLLARVTSATFAEGEFLIRENTEGDCAYLIEHGDVQVVREAGSLEVASMGRGQLVGAISLIKGVKRTASVRARTPVTALKIDKTTFLSMCLSNMFVALLVADLSDRQIAQTRKAG